MDFTCAFYMKCNTSKYFAYIVVYVRLIRDIHYVLSCVEKRPPASWYDNVFFLDIFAMDLATAAPLKILELLYLHKLFAKARLAYCYEYLMLGATPENTSSKHPQHYSVDTPAE